MDYLKVLQDDVFKKQFDVCYLHELIQENLFNQIFIHLSPQNQNQIETF